MGKTAEEMNRAQAITDRNGNLVAVTANEYGARALCKRQGELQLLKFRPATEDDIAEIGRRVVDDI